MKPKKAEALEPITYVSTVWMAIIKVELDCIAVLAPSMFSVALSSAY